MTDRLFDVPAVPPTEPEPDGPYLGQDARRTLRRLALLERGVHPTTRQPLLEPRGEHTCGDCGHRKEHRPNRKTFWKCGAVLMTFGPGSDVRLKWPACTRWIPVPEGDPDS